VIQVIARGEQDSVSPFIRLLGWAQEVTNIQREFLCASRGHTYAMRVLEHSCSRNCAASACLCVLKKSSSYYAHMGSRGHEYAMRVLERSLLLLIPVNITFRRSKLRRQHSYNRSITSLVTVYFTSFETRCCRPPPQPSLVTLLCRTAHDFSFANIQ
jgi:hypothetical protein